MDKGYYALLNAWREERKKEEIRELDDSFYSEIADYSKKLREQTRMLDKTALKGKITEKEKEYVEKMLSELSRIRLRKIIQAELEGQPISSSYLTPEEKTLHSDLRHLISNHRKEMKKIFTGRAKDKESETVEDLSEEEEHSVKVVRFIKPLPAIMGVDMKTYGPFKPEDVAALPEENAENLIRRGFAKIVEMKQ
ncbi:MAG: hypothetical protein ACLFVP_09305 [Candidatus Bathyarchaeia archaeon]